MKMPACNDRSFLAAGISLFCHACLLFVCSWKHKQPLRAKASLHVEIFWQAPKATLGPEKLVHTRKKITSPGKKTTNSQLTNSKNNLITHTNTHPNLADNGEKIDYKIRLAPKLINPDIHVEYPLKARRLKVEGCVRLLLTVSEEGRVIDVHVVSGPAFGLRQAALRVAQKLAFLPATDAQGRAKVAQIEHDVVFRLHDRS
jgi:TonB family protein